MARHTTIVSVFTQDPSCHFNHLNSIIKTICGCFRIWHILFIARVAKAQPGRRFAALCLLLPCYEVGKHITKGLSICFTQYLNMKCIRPYRKAGISYSGMQAVREKHAELDSKLRDVVSELEKYHGKVINNDYQSTAHEKPGLRP